MYVTSGVLVGDMRRSLLLLVITLCLLPYITSTETSTDIDTYDATHTDDMTHDMTHADDTTHNDAALTICRS